MYLQGQNGLMSTFRESWRRRGPGGILISALLIAFYIILYFEPYSDGEGQNSILSLYGFRLFGPLAQSMGLGNKWYFYGFMYCIAMIGGGIYYLYHHGNSRYNQVRIAVNLFVQIIFGFSLPFIMPYFGGKEFYFSYIWPLKYDYFFPSTLQNLPLYMVIYTTMASLVAAPILAYYFGKRWYCSWICGCGGLANTFGDPWRHLTSKSTPSWRFEQVTVNSVMFIAIVMTALVALDFAIGNQFPQLKGATANLKWAYGFFVGSILAGVVGTGLYPIFGPRVWCRNFCPMAAMLGLFQRLGRYQIRVKPNMCISCGNCSTYCEMGIDVRSYAQNNQSFTRASCVGCGMCAHVCPRGVLRLENTAKTQPDKARQGLRVIDL